MTNPSGMPQHSPDPAWLFEGARISHSALGPGSVWRIDDHDGRQWVRLRFDSSGAMLAMPVDQLGPHVQLAEDGNVPPDAGG